MCQLAFLIALTSERSTSRYAASKAREPSAKPAIRPVAFAAVVEHADPAWLGRRIVVPPEALSGSLGSARADAAVFEDALGLLASGHSAASTYGPDGERRGEGMRVFAWAFAPAL
jgi:xanthine dehydrogenase accessory factor